MKEISEEEEEKPFTSSLNINPETCYRKEVGADGVAPPPPLTTTLFPSWSVDISIKDDVPLFSTSINFIMVFPNPTHVSSCISFAGKILISN